MVQSSSSKASTMRIIRELYGLFIICVLLYGAIKHLLNTQTLLYAIALMIATGFVLEDNDEVDDFHREANCSDMNLTSSDASLILRSLGYEWSNEAQCYYSTDFKLGLLTDNQGKELAKRVAESWENIND